MGIHYSLSEINSTLQYQRENILYAGTAADTQDWYKSLRLADKRFNISILL